MYYYRLSHELPAKELLKFEFSKCLNSGENGILFLGVLAILLDYPGNYHFQIFWIY